MRTTSISEAARTLGRTQPAISAAITKLEDELKLALFDRIGGRIIPRPEAYYFLQEAEDVLRQMDRSRDAMRDLAATRLGKLRLTCMPAASDVLIPRLVSRFVQNQPEVSVSLMMRSSTAIWECMALQQYDIGLAEIGPTRHGVDQRPVDLRTVCALPRNHSLASTRDITPTMLSGDAAAALYGEHPITLRTRDHFRETGAQFVQRFELQTFMPALELVEQGLCYCICDPMTAKSYQWKNPNGGNIVFKPFHPSIPCPAAILTPTHRPLSQVAKAFVDLLSIELNTLMDLSE